MHGIDGLSYSLLMFTTKTRKYIEQENEQYQAPEHGHHTLE